MFLLGILGSAFVSAFVPPDFFAGFSRLWGYYPSILLLSLPLYVCATASVPIAFALMHAGIPPGAAMVLLVAGPATNFATLGVVGKLLGKKSRVIYVLTVIVTAHLAGFLFDLLFTLDLSAPEAEKVPDLYIRNVSLPVGFANFLRVNHSPAPFDLLYFPYG